MINLWMLFGCITPIQETGSTSWEVISPIITETEWTCEDDNWSIVVSTEGWTGNGLIWLGDSNRYERHPIYSVEAASDGSADRLRINLTATADWRDTQSGSLTGFYCEEKERLSLFITIHHPQTLETSDCVQLNGEYSNPQEIWDAVNLPTCP